MKISRIDHIVLTVSDVAQATRFYHEVFDMPVIQQQSTTGVTTLRCGHQLIRLQRADRNARKAAHPTVGSADLCIVTRDDLKDVLRHLKSYYVKIDSEPVTKQGSEGQMHSIYLRDPDDNLIEISSYK
ncbi:VOC family protein [Ligilactobacillus sp. LYQ60]|uniref:VOC family protein n=1 Tax=Ligilactobacillus sp. LYQ60 TaxID=3378799 RepID=UPI003853CE44